MPYKNKYPCKVKDCIQPKGQRVKDKVKWAKEILAQYEPKALA